MSLYGSKLGQHMLIGNRQERLGGEVSLERLQRGCESQFTAFSDFSGPHYLFAPKRLA